MTSRRGAHTRVDDFPPLGSNDPGVVLAGEQEREHPLTRSIVEIPAAPAPETARRSS